MPCRDSFISKITVDFIHSFQSSNEQSLQIKLGCYAQEHFHIIGIVHALKRTAAGAARHGLQHGSFHLQKFTLIKESADQGNDLAALNKNISDGRIDNEIDVTLAVADLDVLKAMPLFR